MPTRPNINIFRSKLIWLMPIILSASLLTGCDQKQTKVKSPYPVIDSGVWALSVNRPGVHWLNNNEVIFKSKQREEKNNVLYTFLIWNIGKGIREYSETSSGFTCFFNNKIYYRIGKSTEGYNRYKYGLFGNEKTIIQREGEKKYVDIMNCRIYLKKPGLDKKRDWELLLDKHGYVDKGSLSSSTTGHHSVVLHKPDGSTVPVYIAARDFWIIRYYTFKDAYFIQKLQTDWRPKKNNRPETAWWLYPDGRVEEVKIPYGPWKRYSRFYPTKKGILITARGFKSPKDPGPAGAYLFVSNGKYVKILSGYLQGTIISPDGCKAAFSHHPYLDATLPIDPGRTTLKVINLCQEESAGGQ